jgi:hypothetical protein
MTVSVADDLRDLFEEPALGHVSSLDFAKVSLRRPTGAPEVA